MMRSGLVAALCLTIASGVAAAFQKTVPIQHQGRWVPSKAMCDSPLAVLVTADRLTFINGKDTEALGGIEMAGSGYFAPDYRGIMAVLITEFDGQQPAMVTFNLREKKGVGQVDFAPILPGTPNAQLTPYNARVTKLNLAKRFALDKVPLKKCPAK
jgi:hypothetical protein